MKKAIILVFLIVSFAISSTTNTKCSSKLFSLHANGTQNSPKLRDLVENLARVCKFTIIYDDDMAKKKLDLPVGLTNIDNYTFKEFLKFIFDEHNLFYDYIAPKKILKISYVKTKIFPIDYINMSSMSTTSNKDITVGVSDTSDTGGTDLSSGGSNSDTTSMKSTSEFKFWDTLKSHVDEILQRDLDVYQISSKALLDREAGILTVTGTKKQIDRVNKYILRMQERMHRQIMIETHLIELSYNNDKSTGIDWSKFDLSVSGSISRSLQGSGHGTNIYPFSYNLGYNFTTAGFIKFLKTYGKVNILSNPKIMTLNNQPAVINVGDQLNYRFQSGSLTTTGGTGSTSNTYDLGSAFVGLTLNIVPEITDKGYIIMRINPVSSTLSNTYNDSNNSSYRDLPPDMRIKQMTSIVKVKDGQKVLIGGLIQKKVKKDENKVPVLGSIPLIGYAFRHDVKRVEKNELFILVIPKIINNDNMPNINEAEIIKKNFK